MRKQEALKVIQNCVVNDNYELTEHFIDEMNKVGLLITIYEAE